jgi:hypothetical protein
MGTPERLYPGLMDINDPVLVLGACGLVTTALAILATRLTAAATAEVAAELSDPDPELSRVRHPRRRPGGSR